MKSFSFLPLNDRLVLQVYVMQPDHCGGFYAHWVDRNVYWGHVTAKPSRAIAMHESVDGSHQDVDSPNPNQFHGVLRDLTGGELKFTEKSCFIWKRKRYRPLTQPIYRPQGRFSSFDMIEDLGEEAKDDR